ncbi:hypothetical protein [Polaromonas sp.]|nr:hypothetical protein [Polaromonas sp.]NMM08249.1 hypothetical protein [Polaromonas sp.]
MKRLLQTALVDRLHEAPLMAHLSSSITQFAKSWRMLLKNNGLFAK